MFDGNLDDRILFRILEDIKYISKIKHMVIIDDFVKQMMNNVLSAEVSKFNK